MKIKWQKKQIRNNKIKKPQNESMRKQKLTQKTIVIFRFWHLEKLKIKEINVFK